MNDFFKIPFIDSDASVASPVVSRKSKAETVSSTIQEAEEEDEEQEEEVVEEKKHEKQFLKTSSLASLLPRYFGKYLHFFIRESPWVR